MVPSAWDVILNVFVPEVNNVGGFGVWFAFLKKNEPITSPQLSESKFTFVTDATAPLVFPVSFAPFTTYPKYFSLCAKPIQSTLNNLDVAEYVDDGAGLDWSYGSIIYFSTLTLGEPNAAATSGLDKSPNLWFGSWDLNKPISTPLSSTFTSSKTVKVPDVICISNNLGITSGIPLSKKW